MVEVLQTLGWRKGSGEGEKGESLVRLNVVAPTGLALRRLKQEDYKLNTARKSVLVVGTWCAKAWR